MLYPAELQARSYDGAILPRSRLGCKVNEEKQPTGEGRHPDYAALFQHHRTGSPDAKRAAARLERPLRVNAAKCIVSADRYGKGKFPVMSG
jgi:hypothetical protein